MDLRDRSDGGKCRTYSNRSKFPTSPKAMANFTARLYHAIANIASYDEIIDICIFPKIITPLRCIVDYTSTFTEFLTSLDIQPNTHFHPTSTATSTFLTWPLTCIHDVVVSDYRYILFSLP